MNAQARRLMGKRRSLQLHAERRLKRALAGCKGCVLVHRVVAMMSPEDSWVAKWQRIGEEVSLVQRLRPGQVVAVIPIDFVVIKIFANPLSTPLYHHHHYLHHHLNISVCPSCFIMWLLMNLKLTAAKK